MTKSLDEIARENRTDKSSDYHNYCIKYEKYLPFKREDKIKILEIGVHQGCSLRTWKDFYKNSIVVGIDINGECINYQNISNNIYVEIGSQANEQFLSEVIKKHGPFDLILDDGSHMQSHVLFSFNCLFPSLNSSGVYVVEDTGCSYWPEFEGGLDKLDTSVNCFKNLVDHVNFFGQKLNYPYSWDQRKEELHFEMLKVSNPHNCRVDVESINFLNGVILITKR